MIMNKNNFKVGDKVVDINIGQRKEIGTIITMYSNSLYPIEVQYNKYIISYRLDGSEDVGMDPTLELYSEEKSLLNELRSQVVLLSKEVSKLKQKLEKV